jgi:hypothetical protein
LLFNFVWPDTEKLLDVPKTNNTSSDLILGIPFEIAGHGTLDFLLVTQLRPTLWEVNEPTTLRQEALSAKPYSHQITCACSYCVELLA